MFCHGDNKGIYYWDDAYNFQNSDDENNMYWIANSFNEFIKLLSWYEFKRFTGRKWILKKKNILMMSIVISLCMSLLACSKQPDFDAQSYVKSSLDAEYHREYADYANLMEISEKDAKKQGEEDFNESIRQQFTSSDNITEEEIVAYTEKMAEVKKLAKYKVQDEKKDEDGNYTVSVKVEKKHSGTYELSETERSKLETAMFPTE